MTHKKEVALNRLKMKLDLEREILEKLLLGGGSWFDGEGKDHLVLRVFSDDFLLSSVFKGEDFGDRYYLTAPGWRAKMVISDDEMVAVLDEGVKMVKEQKLKAKLKADKERQKKSKITNMDVFKRVADFLTKNGYRITTPKDENSEILMKCGTVKLWWHNLKDFVSADYGEHGNWDDEGYISIFKVISYWRHKYYKLCYPSLRTLVDKVGVLADVDEHAKVPVAVMDELNRLKI